VGASGEFRKRTRSIRCTSGARIRRCPGVAQATVSAAASSPRQVGGRIDDAFRPQRAAVEHCGGATDGACRGRDRRPRSEADAGAAADVGGICYTGQRFKLRSLRAKSTSEAKSVAESDGKESGE
jgi:hypothetical protein